MSDNFKNLKNGLNLAPKSADPTNPKEGDVFYSDGTSRSKGSWQYKDGAWEQLLSSTGASLDLNTNHLHIADDFPNITNLYGWHINGSGSFDDGDWNGSKALTENGALTSILTDASVNDVLGNDTFCYFDGTNDYLSSTDAVFDVMTGSFSFSCWIRADDWTPTTQERLITKTDFANGWSLQLSTSGNVQFYNYTGAAYEATAYTGGLNAGWHHIAFVRDDGTSSAIYIDGKCMSYTNDHANITDAGNLEIGAANAGTQPFTGGIQEVVIDVDTAWTANQVRKIYAASCGAFVTENAIDDKIAISDGRRNNGHIEIRPTADYNLVFDAGNYSLVTGHQVVVSEDGFYEISAEGTIFNDDTDAINSTSYLKLYDGIIDIKGSHRYFHIEGDSNAERFSTNYSIHINKFLTKDTVISLYARMDTGNNNQIKYTDDLRELFISLKQLD